MIEALSLTFPQLKMLEENLVKILKAENGSEDKHQTTDSKTEGNTLAMEKTLELLKKRTGRDKFTLEELYNPGETIKKYTLAG